MQVFSALNIFLLVLGRGLPGCGNSLADVSVFTIPLTTVLTPPALLPLVN